MFSFREGQCGFCLAAAKMEMLAVFWDWSFKVRQLVDVDKNMVMAGVLLKQSGGGDPHPFKPKPDREGGFNRFTVFGGDKISRCPGG